MSGVKSGAASLHSCEKKLPVHIQCLAHDLIRKHGQIQTAWHHKPEKQEQGQEAHQHEQRYNYHKQDPIIRPRSTFTKACSYQKSESAVVLGMASLPSQVPYDFSHHSLTNTDIPNVHLETFTAV